MNKSASHTPHIFQKVKIVATLGPASDTPEMILKLARTGVNVFRLNLSHYSIEKSLQSIKNIHRAEKILKAPIGILGDLAGPKIRIGDVPKGVKLQTGQKITIVSHAGKDSRALTVNFPKILKSLERGAEIYLGDGLIKLEVIKKTPGGVITRVLVGGTLASRMGFSAQGLALARFKLSRKDIGDIAEMTRAGITALAVSFVQSARDIEAVKKLLPLKNRPMVIAKIETAAGVRNAAKILDAADGLMIARGDLGLSVPIAELPHIQKQLISLALKNAKPVITATQMLESMIHNPLPTRAEVTDVANAILDGTDAVMLSGETAVGKSPVEVVSIMRKIINAAVDRIDKRDFSEEESIADAVSASAVRVADQIGARLIITFTDSGMTARRISRHRHRQPIIALTASPLTLHKLALSWGTHSELAPMLTSMNDLITRAKKIAAKNTVCSLKKGESFVISAGVPFGQSGSTNLILIQKV